jgi:protein-tyrosine phosphatase
MDRNNLRNLVPFVGNDSLNKVCLLMSYVGSGADVADPWYTGDFERTWIDVNAGSEALLKRILEKERIETKN